MKFVFQFFLVALFFSAGRAEGGHLDRAPKLHAQNESKKPKCIPRHQPAADFCQTIIQTPPTTTPIWKYLTSQTPYPIPSAQEQMRSIAEAKDYELIQMHLVSRHGSRFPTTGDINDICELENRVQDPQFVPGQKKIRWMKQFYSALDIKKQGVLDVVGWKDLRLKALRDKDRYRKHMRDAANHRERFKFSSTYVQRSNQSGISYANALFGTQNEQIQFIPKGQDDILLRPWDSCPAFKDVSKDPEAIKAKEEAKELGLKINRHLTADTGLLVDNQILEGMYAICRSQAALCNNVGMWCTVFNVEDLKILEYSKDKTYWFHHGPGFKPNRKMAAPLMKQIFEQMEEAIHGKGGPMFHLRFGHAETVARIYNFFELYKEPTRQLNHDEFLGSMQLPFMANVHFELYRKGDGVFVRMLVNEHPTIMPRCGEMFCPFNKFKEGYHAVSQEPLEQMCAVST